MYRFHFINFLPVAFNKNHKPPQNMHTEHTLKLLQNYHSDNYIFFEISIGMSCELFISFNKINL